MRNRLTGTRSITPVVAAAVLIAASLGSAASSRAAVGSTHASLASVAPAGTNLIRNGGAEVGDASANGWDAVTVPGWRVLRGLPTVVGYGTRRYPSLTSPGPPKRGANLFLGGAGGTSVLAQDIPVRFPAGRPRPADMTFTASAWLGSSGGATDEASLQIRFLGPNSVDLGQATAGPVTRSDRHGRTELLKRSVKGIVPDGTTAIQVRLVLATTATNFDGYWAPKRGFDRAEADDLSLHLSAPVRGIGPLRPPHARVPRFKHVFFFMMENQDFDRIVGSPRAPFENHLLAQGSVLARMFAEEHPSDANYMAVSAGSALGIPLTDPLEENPRYVFNAKNLWDLVVRHHETWKGYLQNANGPCDDTVHSSYWDDDSPFFYFKDIMGRPAYCAAHTPPLTQLTTDLQHASTTPNFSWIAPDDCYDMEGCGVRAGDNFLRSTISQIMRSPAWTTQRSMIVLTWDEDGYDMEHPPQLVPTIIVGSRGVKRGYVSHRRYTHYSLLRTMEASLGLGTLTQNDRWAQPVNDVFAPTGRVPERASADVPVPPLPPPPARGVAQTGPSLAGAAGPIAYVVNQFSNSVTPIDTATDRAGRAIPVGIQPQAIAITPDGATAYVANWGSGSVTPIDTATNRAGPKIRVGSHPQGIAITPDGATAYVANWGSGTVTPIDTATQTAGLPIQVGTYPRAIAITPNGATAYVVNWGSDSVTPIDTATDTAGSPIATGSYPFAIAITPHGGAAFVTDYGSNDVTRIRTATNTAVRIRTGRAPDALAIAGNTVYVVNSDSDSVTPIDIVTNTAGPGIRVGHSPFGIAVAPGGATAYVVDTISGAVTPIDIATGLAKRPISLGRYKYPTQIAITPGGVAEVVDTYAGELTPFDTATNRHSHFITLGADPVAIAIAPTSP